ncbi:TetR/AcrR family transcriptional regulator [Streptomyces sp. ID05-26A]|nr:TetR/AcrR family transcriptional regulator [Streptomyces sp. ID05-26A]
MTRTVSDARNRLLGTASRLFYSEGLHSVGVDRILAEAKVTRATMYRHFAGKEDLVLAYLAEADRATRDNVEAGVAAATTDEDAVRAVAAGIAGHIQSQGFRGCAFLNAVAEYADPEHPVHIAVQTHRRWFLDTVTDLLARVGTGPAELDGRHFAMLRDGAMAAGCLADPGPVADTFREAVDGILRARSS